MRFWQQWRLRFARTDFLEPVYPKVLLIIHDPLVAWEGNRPLSQVLGWHDPAHLVAQYIADLHEASHGLVHYQIAEQITVDGFPVKADGFVYDVESYLFRWRTRTGFHQPAAVDYGRLLAEFQVVGRINLGQIDEVWLLGMPEAGYAPAVMAGPGAFACPSPPLVTDTRCERRFVIMGFDMAQDQAAMLDLFGQRVMATMSRVYRRQRAGRNLWQQFTRTDKSHPGKAGCGTIHFAPNSERELDLSNGRFVASTCADWRNFPQLTGERALVNYQEWGGGDRWQHHLWWLWHLPHVTGHTNGFMNNWWQYIVVPGDVL